VVSFTKISYGWIALVFAAGVILAMTAPGQTAGLSPFTDPLIQELGVSRTAISFSYLIGTLTGALTMPYFGRLIDRIGSKTAIIAVGIGLSLVIYLASFVSDIFNLTAIYIGLRFFGQGALTLAATTLIAKTVLHRPGLALGMIGAIGAAGVSMAPVGFERLIALTDFRTAFQIEALLVLAIVIPIALFLPGKKLEVAKDEFTETGTLKTVTGMRVSEARKTLGFWMIATAMITVGLVSTAFGFHLISILGLQGFSPLEAAATFIPQTVGSLLLAVFVGGLTDKYHPKFGVIIAMSLMALSMLMLFIVQPGFLGLIFGFLIGSSQGAMKGVDTVALVQYFGRAHIGEIRGWAHSIGLISTALGPILLSLGLDVFGNYYIPSLLLLLLPITAIVLAIIDQTPRDRYV
jgi:MFS family permease